MIQTDTTPTPSLYYDIASSLDKTVDRAIELRDAIDKTIHYTTEAIYATGHDRTGAQKLHEQLGKLRMLELTADHLKTLLEEL